MFSILYILSFIFLKYFVSISELTDFAEKLGFAFQISDDILDALNTNHLHGDGKYTKLVKDWFEDKINSNVLLTTSCTAALEMSAILCEIKPGDELNIPFILSQDFVYYEIEKGDTLRNIAKNHRNCIGKSGDFTGIFGT